MMPIVLVSDFFSNFVPPTVMNFLVPGIAGGIVCVILLRTFIKVTMSVDIFEGLF